MAELVFKCPACGTRLSADASRCGETVACTACGGKAAVPRPTVFFPCTACQAELCAPLALVKATIACPNCAAAMAVPVRSVRAPAVPRAAVAGTELRKAPRAPLAAQDPDDTPSASASPVTAGSTSPIGRLCRACGYPLAAGAIVCPSCNINQRTGQRNRFRKPVWLTGRRFAAALPSGALLLFLVIGGRYAWHQYQESRQARQDAAAQQARDQAVATAVGRLRAAATSARMPVLASVLQTIDALQRQPADNGWNRRLADAVAFLGEDACGREIRAGLLAIRGLNQLANHDVRSGYEALEALYAGYGDTPFASMVDTNKVYRLCPKCGGSRIRRAPDQFITGAPASMCGFCNGTGLVIARKEARRQYDAVVDRTLELLDAVSAGGMDLVLLKPQDTPAELRQRWCDPSRRSLVDVLLQLAQQHPDLRLALDPEAMPLLARTPPPAALLAAVANAATLGVVLHAAQPMLVVRSSPISENDTNLVTLVTTETLWAHAMACRHLAQQQPGLAYQVLREASLDDSPAGQRARRLLDLLPEIHSNGVEQAKWEKQVGSSLGRQDHVRRAAGEAMQNLRRSGSQVASAVEARLDADCDAGFITESAWLLSAVLEQDAAACAIEAKLTAGAAVPATGASARPESGRLRLEWLNQAAGMSARSLNDAPFETATNDQQVAQNAKHAEVALLLDRDNLLARAATGYWRVRQAILLGSGAGVKTNTPAELAQDCREGRKIGLLRAAQALAGQSFATPPSDVPKFGTASWMAIDLSAGTGQVVTLAARFTAGAGPVAVQYDGTMGPVWHSAARDVEAWLARFAGARLTNRTVRVTVPSAAASVNADSAGFALALAAVSTLRNAPPRSDVLLAGTLSTNGSLHAVFGADARVEAAVSMPGVEMVVLPSANEPDLLLLSPETLCRCTVVLTDDVTVAVRHALSSAYQHQALEALRRAQALILTGDWQKAQPLLLEAASQAPELFNARRLLQWQACWQPGSGGQ